MPSRFRSFPDTGDPVGHAEYGHQLKSGVPWMESSRPKKLYRKPELKTLAPQEIIRKLQSLASAGDKNAKRMLEAINSTT
jgi:hypothetical protein